ncbi:uncharacterized protein AAES06_000498 [Glossophaga mutica]
MRQTFGSPSSTSLDLKNLCFDDSGTSAFQKKALPCVACWFQEEGEIHVRQSYPSCRYRGTWRFMDGDEVFQMMKHHPSHAPVTPGRDVVCHLRKKDKEESRVSLVISSSHRNSTRAVYMGN